MAEVSETRRIFLLISPILMSLIILLSADFIIGDSKFFVLINQEIVNPVLDSVCPYLSIGIFSVFLIISLIVMYSSGESRSRASGLLSIVSGPISYGVGSLIKVLVRRPRPLEVISARVLGHWQTTTFSFPSTTTMLVFGFTLPILLEKPRYGAPLVILSFFIGFCVVYTGFHFPGDVVAGAFISVAITLCMNKLKARIARFLEVSFGFI